MSGGLNHKITRWKRFASYFAPYRLEEVESALNGSMQLAISKGELKLTTANAVYSYGRHYRSFQHSFDRLEVLRNKALRKVLVLGWGIGSIAALLKHHPTIKLVVGVEHDPVLVELYRKLNLKFPFNIEILTGDVFEILKDHQGSYDMICSDIFVDNVTPDGIVSTDYIMMLHGLLNTNGIAMISKLNRSHKDLDQNNELIRICGVNDISVKAINTMGNTMYYWMKV